MKKLVLLLPVLLLFWACEKDSNAPADNSFNLFTVDDDIALGQQLRDTILNDPEHYSVLDSAEYTEAYQYLDSLKTLLLSTDQVAYNDRFEWQLFIIEDSTVNAFCAPGGYIFFYTGIFNVIENEAQLTGILAHEMAHAARRHTTDNMTQTQGIALLLNILLGDEPSELAVMASNLALGLEGLAFSRKQEYEADEYAVKYMSASGDWEPRAIGDFFDILKEMQGESYTPVFLSTHPSPEDRSEKIQEHWTTYSGKDGAYHTERYLKFKALFQ
ncbi:M48 family metallopeptidase [Saccharicrinis sp. FJH54]|uniref:M48 family metallopeptidase n=1 Tax=Saccharicrinis sp. FJH54 TaxID=3344665 RepID=UPI0035D4EFE8